MGERNGRGWSARWARWLDGSATRCQGQRVNKGTAFDWLKICGGERLNAPHGVAGSTKYWPNLQTSNSVRGSGMLFQCFQTATSSPDHRFIGSRFSRLGFKTSKQISESLAQFSRPQLATLDLGFRIMALSFSRTQPTSSA